MKLSSNCQARSLLAKGAVIFLIFIGCRRPVIAALSERSYCMRGELTWTFRTNTFKVPTEILRSGDTIKLTQIIQPQDSNYFAMVYLCTSNLAISFSQYGKDITGVHRIGDAWNNGSVLQAISRFQKSVDKEFLVNAPTFPTLAATPKSGKPNLSNT